MAVPKQRSAIWALAAAGGLWAWQNRDKVRGFIEQQRGNIERQVSQTRGESALPSFSAPTAGDTPAYTPVTGETRRIGGVEPASGEFTNETRTTYDPSI